MTPELLFAVGKFMAATDRWDYHSQACASCHRRQPCCYEGIELHQRMWESLRAAQEADRNAAAAEPVLTEGENGTTE